MNDDLCEVIITAPNEQWIAEFTRRLVEARLVACGHVSTTIRSIYRWDNQVHDETESRVALHTRREHVAAIIERTKATHPYEVPCVLSLPIADGNPEYLQWVRDQTE